MQRSKHNLRELTFSYEYEDFLQFLELTDTSQNRTRWLHMVAVVKNNWSDTIDNEIEQCLKEAWDETFGGEDNV
jgi:hypothetical protein